MTYRDTARAFVRAENETRAGFTPTPGALAADRLPLSPWAEPRRAYLSPQTIAHNHALHVSDTAHALRAALWEADTTTDPMGRLSALADVEDAANALLAAIGEGE